MGLFKPATVRKYVLIFYSVNVDDWRKQAGKKFKASFHFVSLNVRDTSGVNNAGRISEAHTFTRAG